MNVATASIPQRFSKPHSNGHAAPARVAKAAYKPGNPAATNGSTPSKSKLAEAAIPMGGDFKDF